MFPSDTEGHHSRRYKVASALGYSVFKVIWDGSYGRRGVFYEIEDRPTMTTCRITRYRNRSDCRVAYETLLLRYAASDPIYIEEIGQDSWDFIREVK